MQSTINWKGADWELEYDYDPPEPCRIFECGIPLEPSYGAHACIHSVKVNGVSVMDFLSEWTIEGLEDRIVYLEEEGSVG